jgi:hypothetical protein
MATGAAAFRAERGSGEAQCVPTFLIEVIVLLHDEVANGGSKEAGGGGEGRRRWAQGEESQIGAAVGTGVEALYRSGSGSQEGRRQGRGRGREVGFYG